MSESRKLAEKRRKKQQKRKKQAAENLIAKRNAEAQRARQQDWLESPVPRQEVRQLFNVLAVNLNELQKKFVYAERRMNFLEAMMERCIRSISLDERRKLVEELLALEDYAASLQKTKDPCAALDSIEAWLSETEDGNFKNMRFLPYELLQNLIINSVEYPEDNDAEKIESLEATVNSLINRLDTIRDTYIPEQVFFMTPPQTNPEPKTGESNNESGENNESDA